MSTGAQQLATGGKESHSRQDSRNDLSFAVVQSEEDVVAEYNFFARTKKAVQYEQQSEKRKLDAQRRIKEREEALKWRQGGREVLKAVSTKVAEMRFMLKPHLYLRRCVEVLADYESRLSAYRSQRCRHSVGISYEVLTLAQVEHKPRKFLTKTNLICHKALVMRSIHIFFKERYPLYYEYKRPVNNLTLFRALFRCYMRFVTITDEMSKTLTKKRAAYKQACAKLDLIHRTQEACAFIETCKSRQHQNVKGCSNCGVIFMGGSLQGAIPYVKSVSRDTGVPTLVTLAFELDTLAHEETVQLDIVSKALQDLMEYESVVYSLMRASVQPWWCIVLAYKRTLRNHMHVLRSAFYYRVRRLSKLKHEVDQLIKEPQPLDHRALLEKYCDFPYEAKEYILLQEQLKQKRLAKYAAVFSRKLHSLVHEGRERRYQEWLRMQNMPKPPKPIKIKTLRPEEASVPRQHERLICYRWECQGRNFLTRERWAIHQQRHIAEDEERHLILQRHREAFAQRSQVSRAFLEQVKRVRQYMLDHVVHEIAPDQQGVITSNTPMQAIINQISKGHEDDFVLAEQAASVRKFQYFDHSYQLLSLFHPAPAMTLTLVSKHSSVIAPAKVALDRYFLRVGTRSDCEVPITLSGLMAEEGRIAAVHCLIYIHPQSDVSGQVSTAVENDPVKYSGTDSPSRSLQNKSHSYTSSTQNDSFEANERLSAMVVDNHSRYGAYLVGETGGKKISHQLSHGATLRPGSLLCLGVCLDGPPVLSAADASLACIVYQFNIGKME